VAAAEDAEVSVRCAAKWVPWYRQDGDFWGSGYGDRLADDVVTLLTPDKARIAATSVANAKSIPPDS
jgi:hypothetical protein